MSYLTYLPLALIVVFALIGMAIMPRLTKDRKNMLLAFCAGYIAHAILQAAISALMQ
jgi:ABC-type polysaccharide/polyol phosphate export permease